MIVSVIIPTYNCAPRLLRALRSVAAQTYRDIEIVVVDDGSTDDTADRVAEWTAQSGANVRYVRQPNAGPAAARNHGMRLASGDAIGALMARGDTILAADWLGYTFLLGVTIAVLGSAAWGRGIG